MRRSEDSALLEMRGISKSFPGVRALEGVDFTVRAGEVHGLMGENGAGKSTLIKALTGVYPREAGRITFDGRAISPRSPKEAETLGISTVYQEVNLIPYLSVAENICLGRQPTRFGAIRWRAVRRRAEAALQRLELGLDVSRQLSSCSIAIQQMVAIARALDTEAKLLILDEPTSSLDENEVAELFGVLGRLREAGMGILFVTHFLDQVYEISDRITVLRDGRLVGEFETASLPRVELVGHMIGRQPEQLASRRDEPDEAADGPGEDLLVEVAGLGRAGSIAPTDMTIRPGEVVGVAGLLGSGRTELARLLFGIDRAETGQVLVEGRPATLSSPRRAIKLGFAFTPENRKVEGLIASLSVRENIVLALQANRGTWRAIPRRQQAEIAARFNAAMARVTHWASDRREVMGCKTLLKIALCAIGRLLLWATKRSHRSSQGEIADRFIRALDIKTPGAEQTAGNLSGGNQQKVLLARWLATEPRLLILDEPTRGIDVGAKAEIEKLIARLCAGGMSIVFISSELEEIVRDSHRVVVLRDRAKVDELIGGRIDEQTIMHSIAGGEQDG